MARWFLGGELVGGEVVPWWRVGWWRGGSLVASWLVARFPGGEMTGNHADDLLGATGTSASS